MSLNKQELNLKVFTAFILIAATLSTALLAGIFYQERKFEKITKADYIKHYGKLVVYTLKDSLYELDNIGITYSENGTQYIQKNTKTLMRFNIAAILILKGLKPLFIRTNTQITYNNIDFSKLKKPYGFILIKNKIYLYSKCAIKDSHGLFLVLLRPLFSIKIIKETGHISLTTLPKSNGIKTIDNIPVAFANNQSKSTVLLLDDMHKPIAALNLLPKVCDIFVSHRKLLKSIFVFVVTAILISLIFSYLFLKHTLLNDINSIINSVNNIKNDFKYSPPTFKNKQFQDISNTIIQLIERIEESEYIFTKVAESMPVGIIVYRNTPIYANRYASEFFGSNIVGKPLIDFIDNKHRKMIEHIKKRRISGDIFDATYTVELKKPKGKIIRISSQTIKYGKKPAGLMIFIDVTTTEKVKNISNLLNDINNAIIQSDDELNMLEDICNIATNTKDIRYAWLENAQNEIILGKSNCNIVLAKCSTDDIYIKNTQKHSIIIIPVTVENDIKYRLIFCSDVIDFFDDSVESVIKQMKLNIELSIERLRTQKEKNLMLLYDTLTGLKNFNYLKNDINTVAPCVLIYINIRNFSLINQVYGFTFADKILKEIGATLRKNVKSRDEIYRMQGDKFAILINEEFNKENIATLIKRLKDIFISFEIDSKKIPIHIDVGITSFPSLTNQKEKIIESAETALVKSKETKDICFYSTYMQKEIENNFKIETYIRKAIEKRLFFFHYQPILNLKTNTIEKAEALIRLKDNDGNFINPEQFISIAEKVNIINDITKIVIESVFSKIPSLSDIDISINLSSKDIENKDILSLIESSIERYNLQKRSISIELTERDIMNNFEATKRFIEKMKKLNIEIEIDDFGIGYSSFDRIANLDFDILKIDKSLVDMVGINKKAENIITYIIKLAHSLNAKALAEGIENRMQFEFLKENGCDYIQGYYISKPLPIDELKQFLQNG